MIQPPPVTQSLRLRWSGCSDRGKVRQNNEDSFLGLQFDARETHRLGRIGEASVADTDLVFAVCDGMGGAKAGEFASKIAVEKIASLLPKSFKQSAKGLESGFADVLNELFTQVHRAVAYLGNSYVEIQGMETTMTLGWFTPGWLFFGHTGDSRLYYLSARNGGIKQLSHDDTYVGWLFRTGKLNEREAKSHPRRSVLQKSLGGNNQLVDPQVGAVAFELGDIFLLCTDGLVDGLYDQSILELLRPTADFAINDQTARHLVDEAIERSGRDNTTALVVQVV